jgi:hypothetical protein
MQGEENKITNITASDNSFLVKIKYRQNSSWQGTVQWIETGKTQNFKSCLELIRLMDIAVTSDKENEENNKIDWN